MNEKQLAGITKLAQQQQEQIKMLVNLLFTLLNEEPGERNEAARNAADNLIFIRTNFYELIEDEGDEAKARALKHEQIKNKLRRRIIEKELEQYE